MAAARRRPWPQAEDPAAFDAKAKTLDPRTALRFKDDGAVCLVLIFAFGLPPSEARQAGQTA
jgi:hypothetical protein